MKRIAYNTGTMKLMPYTEQGEFCMVGVFAVNEETRELHYQLLESQNTSRLTAFFPEVEPQVFSDTLKRVRAEWERLGEMATVDAGTDQHRDLLKAITYPREGMIRHRERGVVLTDKVEDWLQQTFNKMVLRMDQGSDTALFSKSA